MLGTLYKITNTVNGKCYIGKTYRSVKSRFGAHKRDAERFKHRPLYRAINKYGFDCFTLENLGSFPEGILETEEIKAIETYDSFKNGYNATLGGDGKRYRQINENDVVADYNSGLGVVDLAHKYKVCASAISAVLKGYNIDCSKGNYKRKICVVDADMEFSSVSECAKYLIEAEMATGSYRAVTQGINKAVSGDRHTYLGLTFAAN